MATTLANTILARWRHNERQILLGQVGAAICGGLLLGFTAGHLFLGARKELVRRDVAQLLAASDGIAEEWTEVGEDVRSRWANRLMMDAAEEASARIPHREINLDEEITDLWGAEAPEAGDAEGEVPPTQKHEQVDGGNLPAHVEVQRRGRIEYSGDVLEVKRHRRIRSRRLYIQAVVAECKNRFGTPLDTPANHLAVRRFALDRMTAHNVRPTHIYQVLPLVVELVFCRATHEEEAEQLAKLYRFKPWWERFRAWVLGPRVDPHMC